MTKAEERKILEQIVDLIQSTPMDSYIRNAFSGVPEYAVRNIEDDGAYNPVEERNMWEKRCYDKDCELQKTREIAEKERCRADFQKDRAESAIHKIEEFRKQADEWEKNAHDAGDLYCELEAECAEKDAEIMRLKAEIYDLRKGVIVNA